MVKNILLAAVCCLPMGLFAQNGFTIHGKVGSLDAPAKAVIVYKDAGRIIKDSALLHNGQFSFSGRLSSPTDASIVLEHDTVAKSRTGGEDYLGLYIENANITITARDSIKYAVVKGSAADEDQKTLMAMQRPYRHVADSIVRKYNASTPEQRLDTTGSAALRIVMQQTQKGFDSVTRVFIYAHPDSYISLQAFHGVEMGYNFNPDTAAVRFARFTKSQQESVYGKKLQETIDIIKRTGIGRMATDFTENDSTGKPVSLSDFRGQYVLLDFWASWCHPCRAENPNYLKAYNKYKDKKFTILGVSLDSEKARLNWLAAVRFDQLPWTQISDLKGFKSKSAEIYGVEAIPTNFLIDPDGKIIGKNLRGDDLDKTLSRLFSM